MSVLGKSPKDARAKIRAELEAGFYTCRSGKKESENAAPARQVLPPTGRRVPGLELHWQGHATKLRIQWHQPKCPPLYRLKGLAEHPNRLPSPKNNPPHATPGTEAVHNLLSLSRGHSSSAGSSRRMGAAFWFLSCRGCPPSTWAHFLRRRHVPCPRLCCHPVRCLGLMLSSCTCALLPHHRLSGSRSRFSGGRGVEYLDAAKDTYQFTEVEQVGPFEWYFAPPGFSRECFNGTSLVRTD